MSGHRQNIGTDGAPVQQSMTIDQSDYRGVMKLNRLMQGIVIDVYPSDDEQGNRTSWQHEDRMGFHHECSVLVVNDGASTYMVLPHVVIPPDAPSGMDDYVERLPRPSTCLTTGEALQSGGAQVDPYDLDGDMCIVGFIGGLIDQPFIISWWPHPRNGLDPATAGLGSPDSSGVGRALEQHRRYFRRVNGVETVVCSTGDVVISTTFAGSQVVTGEGTSSTRGRFQRQESDAGGSIRVYVKPTQTVEWVWDPQEDGIGAGHKTDPELPQPNPPSSSSGPQETSDSDTPDGTPASPTGDAENTYISVDKETWRVKVPVSFEVLSSDEITLEASNLVYIESISGSITTLSETDTTIEAKTVLELEAPQIKVGRDASEALVLGDTLEQVLTDAIVQTAMGPANFDAATITAFLQFKSVKHVVE